MGAIHFPNQSDDGWGDGFPSGFEATAFPSPKKSKPHSMPSDDGAGLNQAEPDFPTIPNSRKPRPQAPIDKSQPWSVVTSAQDQQLVAQSQVLQQQVVAGFQFGHDQTEQKN
jgi:hypothetical protein